MVSEHIRSNLIGYIALFFAMGLGSAWAATELERNEVKSKHIGNGQVKDADLANDAVSSPKVANGSLLDEDFAAGQLPQGPQGERGPQGLQGEPGLQGQQGAPGLSGLERVTATSANDSVSGKFAIATCPGTKKVVGTGAGLEGNHFESSLPTTEANVVITRIELTDALTSVNVGAAEEEPVASEWRVVAFAICANVSN
jgi:hypothetical protein